MMASRSAFTLVEMTVVVAIIALFVATVAVRYKAPLATARVQNVIEQLEHQDRLLRNFALRHNRSAKLVVDHESGTFTPQCKGSGETGIRSISLPTGVQIDGLYMGGKVINEINYASNGTTHTYTLGFKSGQEETIWLLVVGATGQTVRLAKEEHLAELGVGPKR